MKKIFVINESLKPTIKNFLLTESKSKSKKLLEEEQLNEITSDKQARFFAAALGDNPSKEATALLNSLGPQAIKRKLKAYYKNKKK